MRIQSLSIAAAAAAVSLFGVEAHAQNVLSPADTIIGIDNNRNLPGNSNTGTEGPAAAFDENPGAVNTKWFTGAREFSGAIITSAGGPATVKSLQFTSANDSANRDPVTFQLFGTNNPITTAANGTGLEDVWTFIASGNTGLATSGVAATVRNTTVSPVDVINNTAYSSYKIVFPALRLGNDAPNTPSNPNGMQINEIRLFNAAAGGGTNVGLNPTLLVPIDQTDSAFPPAEGPKNAIDGNPGTKYLNFGREGSGFIVTPAAGSTTVGSFRVTTANDAPGRDPAAYALYGTNSAITSIENSEGNGEAWTLISSGNFALPGDPAINNDQRGVAGPIVEFTNGTPYTSYKMIFTDNKSDTGTNSIQYGEVELFNVPEPTSMVVLGIAAIGALKRRRRA